MMQLGLLAELRDDDAGALDWTIRGAALFGDFRYLAGPLAFPHPMKKQALQRLVHLFNRLGDGMLTDRWRAVTGSELPKIVQSYLIHVQFVRDIEEVDAKYRTSGPPKKRGPKKKSRPKRKKNRRTR